MSVILRAICSASSGLSSEPSGSFMRIEISFGLPNSWIVGSPKDAPAGDAIVAIGATLGAAPIDLTGKTKLLEAVDLLALADAVVSNDSGLMHVAGALGRPVVAIYGSTSPDVTPPLGPRSAVAEIELPCRPCFQRVCPLGHTNCLNLLTPALVEEKLFQSA